MKYSGRLSGDVRDQGSRETGPRKLSTGTRLYVGMPLDPPSEALLNCVREMSKHAVSISAAYAFNMALGDDPPTLSIGLYFDTKPDLQEVEDLFRHLGRNMKPFINDKDFVDLLPLDPSNVLAVTVREQIEPFYTRVVQ